MGRNYATIIFQKAYWPEYAALFAGVKILDLCDPDFLNWNSQCLAMADACDAVTTSTEELAKFVRRYTRTPTICIPDRVNFHSVEGRKKSHLGNGHTRTAVWFGYGSNFSALDSAIPDLVAMQLRDLIVISDAIHPYRPPLEFYDRIRVVNYAWCVDTYCDRILEADIAINFRLASGRWRFKSNNKTLLAWALGLPVAHTRAELSELLTEQGRIEEANLRYEYVRLHHDVRQSVREYRSLITEIQGGPSGLPCLFLNSTFTEKERSQ